MLARSLFSLYNNFERFYAGCSAGFFTGPECPGFFHQWEFFTMSLLTIAGLAAAILTTFAFAPQTLKTLKTRDTKSISVLMYGMYLMGVLLWVGYGLSKPDWIIVAANGLGFLLALPVFYIAIQAHYTHKKPS